MKKLRLKETPDDLPAVRGRARVQRNTDSLPRPLHSRCFASTKQPPLVSLISAASSLCAPPAPMQCYQRKTDPAGAPPVLSVLLVIASHLLAHQLTGVLAPADENNCFALKGEYWSVIMVEMMAM